MPDLPTYVFEPTWGGLLSFVLTAVLPLLVALLSRAVWTPTAKGILLLLLAAIKVGVEAVIAGGYGSLPALLLAMLANFLIAVGVYFGLLRGSTVQAGLLAIGSPPRPR